MARLKESKTYYFSVEGETEKWYLDWLVSIINNTEYSTHKVSIEYSAAMKSQYRRRGNHVSGTENHFGASLLA